MPYMIRCDIQKARSPLLVLVPVVYRRRIPNRPPSTKPSSSTWRPNLALAGKDDWDAQRVPAYVEREFRRYKGYGIGNPTVPRLE